jgi:hypothetical protein
MRAREELLMIRIIVRSYGSVFYYTAEGRAAAEMLRSCIKTACPHAEVEVYRGDVLLT